METLPKNLDDNRAMQDCVEFVLVDFNGEDLRLQQWVTSQFAAELASGYLRYVWTNELVHWHAALAKNTAHVVATGDILVNLDGDNFVGALGAQCVLDAFHDGFSEKSTNARNSPDFQRMLPSKTSIHSEKRILLHQSVKDGTYGRIGCRRSDFFRVGGYDQSFLPMVYEDTDFIDRLRMSGAQYTLSTNPEFAYALINTKEDSVRHCGQDDDGTKKSWIRMHRHNCAKSFSRKHRPGAWLRNVGECIGIPLSKLRVFSPGKKMEILGESLAATVPRLLVLFKHLSGSYPASTSDLSYFLVAHFLAVLGSRLRESETCTVPSDLSTNEIPISMVYFPVPQPAHSPPIINGRFSSNVALAQLIHQKLCKRSLLVRDPASHDGPMLQRDMWRDSALNWAPAMGPFDPSVGKWFVVHEDMEKPKRRVFFREFDNSHGCNSTVAMCAVKNGGVARQTGADKHLFVVWRAFYFGDQVGIGSTVLTLLSDKDHRFTDPGNVSTSEVATDSVLDNEEQIFVETLCQKLFLDFGSVDIIRDAGDGDNIYVIDVNARPVFPQSGWTSDERERWLGRHSHRFGLFLQWWAHNSST